MSSLNFSTSFEDITFSVVDTETTGMKIEDGAEIIEIGAVCIRPPLTMDQINVFSSLIYTDAEIDPSAEAVHGISREMLKDAPPVNEVMKGFSDFINGSVVVAHNARFDMKFIQQAYSKCGMKNNIPHVCDTVILSRKLFPHLSSHSLDSLISYLGVNVPDVGGHRHRALYDAEHTALILLMMLDRLQDQGLYTLGDLYSFIHS